MLWGYTGGLRAMASKYPRTASKPIWHAYDVVNLIATSHVEHSDRLPSLNAVTFINLIDEYNVHGLVSALLPVGCLSF